MQTSLYSIKVCAFEHRSVFMTEFSVSSNLFDKFKPCQLDKCFDLCSHYIFDHCVIFLDFSCFSNFILLIRQKIQKLLKLVNENMLVLNSVSIRSILHNS